MTPQSPKEKMLRLARRLDAATQSQRAAQLAGLLGKQVIEIRCGEEPGVFLYYNKSGDLPASGIGDRSIAALTGTQLLRATLNLIADELWHESLLDTPIEASYLKSKGEMVLQALVEALEYIELMPKEPMPVSQRDIITQLNNAIRLFEIKQNG